MIQFINLPVIKNILQHLFNLNLCIKPESEYLPLLRFVVWASKREVLVVELKYNLMPKTNKAASALGLVQNFIFAFSLIVEPWAD